jgi:pilus assembly protein CpaE
VFSSDRIDEVYLDRLLASCAEHLSLLAAPSMLDKVYDFDPDAFAQLIDVAQRTSPYVVLDVPHVWNGWTRRTLEQADEVVVVAAPELANLRNAKNVIDTLRKLRPNDFAPRLILNQVGMPKRPEIAVADFAEPLGIEPEAVIPFDAQLFGTAVQQRPHAGRNGCRQSDRRQPVEYRASGDRPRCHEGKAEIRFEGHAFDATTPITTPRCRSSRR